MRLHPVLDMLLRQQGERGEVQALAGSPGRGGEDLLTRPVANGGGRRGAVLVELSTA